MPAPITSSFMHAPEKPIIVAARKIAAAGEAYAMSFGISLIFRCPDLARLAVDDPIPRWIHPIPRSADDSSGVPHTRQMTAEQSPQVSGSWTSCAQLGQ